MTTAEIVPIDQRSSFDLLPTAFQMAEKLARTEFVPAALRGKPDSIMACILTGHEMGISPMQALAKIHIIEGRPGPSAELMRAVVLAHGHEIWIEETTTTRVTVCGRRNGSEHTSKITWTLDDARKAGLDGRQNWKKYPRAMLTARATGELVRNLFPDVLAGLTYTAEELSDGFEEWGDPEPPEQAPAEPTGNVRQIGATKKPPAKKAAAKRAAPKRAPEPPAAEDLPPLPDDDDIVDAEIVEDEPAPSPPADEERLKKARQRIAMMATELGVDRADVIYAVTGGSETRLSNCDLARCDLVAEAMRRLKVGEVRLEFVDDEPALVDAPPAANEPELPAEPEFGDDNDPAGVVADEAPHGWDLARWKDELRTRGVKMVATLREAQKLAGQMGEPEPGNLGDLAGRESLAALTWVWVLEQAGEG